MKRSTAGRHRRIRSLGPVRRATLLGCALAVLLSVTTAAHADPPGPDALPITVVAVKSDDALDQAEALTGALRKAVRDAKGWSLGEGKTQSLEFLILQMKCPEPIDAICEARIADVIEADRYLWSVIQMSGDFITGTLNLWVRGKGTSRAPLKYSANLTDPTDDALVRVARQAVEDVTGGPPKGSVRVSTGGVAGQLYVDDEPLGALDAEGGTFQLPAGKHRIVVKAPGHADAETTVEVRPATTVDAQLTLIEVGEESSVDGRMIGGFAALGAGVAAGAVGLWAALEVNSLRDDPGFDRYRANFSETEDVCAKADEGVQFPQDLGAMSATEASDACSKASSMEIVQAVMFPLAAVAAGVGGYLLGTSSLAGGSDDGGDEPSDSAGLYLRPSVGPQLQRVQVIYRF